MIIQFYEKPGCINNTRQKLLLESYGHTVIAHSILSEQWTNDKLRPFFGALPVHKWFNMAALVWRSVIVAGVRHSVFRYVEVRRKSPDFHIRNIIWKAKLSF